MHGHYRKILLPLFTPRMLDHLTPGIRQTSRELAHAIATHDVADASKGYARAVVTIVFSRLCGFPEEDWPKFDQWVDDIIYEPPPTRSAPTPLATRCGRTSTPL